MFRSDMCVNDSDLIWLEYLVVWLERQTSFDEGDISSNHVTSLVTIRCQPMRNSGFVVGKSHLLWFAVCQLAEVSPFRDYFGSDNIATV